MQEIPDRSTAQILLSQDAKQVVCQGAWTIQQIESLKINLQKLNKKIQGVHQIDVSQIEAMDSAGALCLCDLVESLRNKGENVNLTGMKKKFYDLYQIISHETQQLRAGIQPPEKRTNLFYVIGRWGYEKYEQLTSFFAFFGELMTIMFQSLMNPARIQWRATFKVVDESGYRALPIIALMLFLIGIVISYQLAAQLRVFGADIFVVDVSGVAILREFGPLIAAIIMAGRTSTAFSALIGTMKVNEEIDALRTMGVLPIEKLVLPRIFGLMIAMPLLTVWANIFGILGSMIMAKAIVNIDFMAFLERFRQTVPLQQFMLGEIKAPVFAIIIAAVGCFQGFQTGSTADSVGRQTTRSAVQAIFLIIVADSAFSILFSLMNV